MTGARGRHTLPSIQSRCYMSPMTQIHLSEVETISRHSKRPRFALCTWLALLDMAEGKDTWEGPRGELTREVEALLPPGRYEERTAARKVRLGEVRKEIVANHKRVEEEAEDMSDAESREVFERVNHGIVALAEKQLVGDPIGTNVSRVLSELKSAGLVHIEYVDGAGEYHAKAARGRSLSIQIYRKP